jgi:hypothetical protein
VGPWGWRVAWSAATGRAGWVNHSASPAASHPHSSSSAAATPIRVSGASSRSMAAARSGSV